MAPAFKPSDFSTRFFSRADEGRVPTSGRRRCAPCGVGDDSGIVLPIQHERFAGSGPSGREPSNAAVGDAGPSDERSRTDGLPFEVLRQMSCALQRHRDRTSCECAMRAIGDTARRSETRSKCGRREVEGCHEAPVRCRQDSAESTSRQTQQQSTAILGL